MRKEVSVVRKKIDSVNKELKPLGMTCQKKVRYIIIIMMMIIITIVIHTILHLLCLNSSSQLIRRSSTQIYSDYALFLLLLICCPRKENTKKLLKLSMRRTKRKYNWSLDWWRCGLKNLVFFLLITFQPNVPYLFRFWVWSRNLSLRLKV